MPPIFVPSEPIKKPAFEELLIAPDPEHAGQSIMIMQLQIDGNQGSTMQSGGCSGMIDETTLDLAVTRGVLDEGQRRALIALAEENRPVADVDRINAEPSVDDQMRLVGGGNDIFVTVGIILLFSGRCSHCNRFLLRATTLSGSSWP
jgi:hypothetical protein